MTGASFCSSCGTRVASSSQQSVVSPQPGTTHVETGYRVHVVQPAAVIPASASKPRPGQRSCANCGSISSSGTVICSGCGKPFNVRT